MAIGVRLENGCEFDVALTLHDIPFFPPSSLNLGRSRDPRRAGPDDARGARVVVPVRRAGRDRHAARERLAKVERVGGQKEKL